MAKGRIELLLLVLLLFGSTGCQEKGADEASQMQILVEALYGPTFVMIPGVSGSVQKDIYFYVVPSSVASPSTPEREWLRAQTSVARLVNIGPSVLPFLFGALFDDRVIPRQWIVGYFPDDEEFVGDLRVCDKAAAVFSAISASDISFLERRPDGGFRRIPPNKRIAVLASAYEIVLQAVEAQRTVHAGGGIETAAGSSSEVPEPVQGRTSPAEEENAGEE